jgi:diaminopimelate decarboxylase
MDYFPYISERLCCEQVSLASVAERFGTPTYVYSRSGMLDNFTRVQKGLAGVPSLVCYSVKANSNLKILRVLREAGAGFDIVSAGELARVLKAGADPGRVVFSGVGKTVEEIDAAIRAGILMFNVESAGEMDAIEARARERGKPASVAVRINPDVEAETHPYISTGQFIHKFGVPKEESVDLCRRAARSPALQVRGIACHIGSQILQAGPFLKALDEILEISRQLRSEGIQAEYLDLGGGYGIQYVDEKPLEMEHLIQEIKRRLAGAPYRLILEPGRAIVGNTGVLLTRVLYVKQNRQKNFVIVDSGMSDLLRPALYGSEHRILPVEKHKGGRLRADVVGPLCETGDFLGRDRELPDVEPGDLLAVMTAGAYGFALASNYNSRPRPAEVMVSGVDVELIRSREQIEDLMAGEVS